MESRFKSSTEDLTDRVTAPIPDQNLGTELPLTLSASIDLSALPPDAQLALARVDDLDQGKVIVHFKPLPGAPHIKQKLFKITASQKFGTVVGFLRKKLGMQNHQSVLCYVNSVFAPGLDQSVGSLWRCFKTDDQLIVSYSLTPAFG